MPGTKFDFELGEYTVSPQRCRIDRGGDSVHVKPKTMAVLDRLARADGAVVTRGDLFDQVWPGGVVTDDVLTQCIVELRKAFGDSAREPRYIETIPKVGFRLVPKVLPATGDRASNRHATPAPREPISTESAGTRPPIRPARWATSVSLVMLVVAAAYWTMSGTAARRLIGAASATKSVAVLPFVDLSAAGDQEYFADGLSEELINKLTQLDGLRVTGRTSSFYFRNRNEDLRTIGKLLDVDHVIEGSVRKSSGQLRITAQLVDVTNGFHIWADTYDRPVADIFAIQSEIAESVAAALSIRLGVGKLAAVYGGTTNVEAFEQVMRGNALYRQFTAESIARGSERYAMATYLDPNYALAWALLADINRNARLVLPAPEANMRRKVADDALERALELAPTSPHVLRTAAQMYIDEAAWSKVERALRRAQQFDTNACDYLSGEWTDLLAKTGRAAEATEAVERLKVHEPLGPGISMYLGHLYAMQGRTAEALAELELGYAKEGQRPLLAVEGMVTALANGDRDSISLWLERAIETQQPGAMRINEIMAEKLDNPDAALTWLHHAFASQAAPDYYVAVWASYFGDVQLALEAIIRSRDTWLFWAPIATAVRGEPGFRALVREMGLVAYWREFGWADSCRAVGDSDFICT